MIHPTNDIDYLQKHGSLSAWIRQPQDFQGSSTIAVLSIQVDTECDPKDRCTARMDILIVNDYRIGRFDEPQSIQWFIGIKELRMLKAFPWLHDILIAGEDNQLSLPDFIKSFVAMGGNKSDTFDADYDSLRSAFDASSDPAKKYLDDFYPG